MVYSPKVIEDSKSPAAASYKSTPSTRSSVLEKARQVTRKLEPEEKKTEDSPSRRYSRGTATPKTTTTATASPSRREQQQQEEEAPQQAGGVVSPELLVDALSGQEDGLLAIAETLMEHYDKGYDVMGEAIIDAFADVQKLFQHVVEAAHMEGAAFEASRAQEEIAELRQQLKAHNAGNGGLFPSASKDESEPPVTPAASSQNQQPVRHDEFVDSDVKDILTTAIRKSTELREEGKFKECLELLEGACQESSALLPVDSDHRGRLQLSLARAESMPPDRACAILRYTMDDVLRSGMRAHRSPYLPDPSQRADVVLKKPRALPLATTTASSAGAAAMAVMQSNEEALASLVTEMKEVLEAPMYKETPVYAVAQRFWTALTESQKAHSKNEERLEQHLAKLKGDYLLARAEWEEKLNKAQDLAENYQQKYNSVRDHSSASSYPPRPNASVNLSYEHPTDASTGRSAPSVASLGSSMAQHARSLVGSFACHGLNERTGGTVNAELQEGDSLKIDGRKYAKHMMRDKRQQQQAAAAAASSRSFRDYSKSPQRVDI